MTEEDIIDCIMEIDEILSEAESALEEKKYAIALSKVREAKEAIEELRTEDYSDDMKSDKPGRDMINRIK